MNEKEERKIIFRAVNEAVNEACKNDLDRSRQEVAALAARFANRRGVNIASAPYLHDIFCEALDKKEGKGAFFRENF